ncbi:CreA family protein [Roseobacter sp.]|uniref:CreA family protein n=1 Tax=Roseobacter sp. TaxID=1907202 RepID=UPI00329A03A5
MNRDHAEGTWTDLSGRIIVIGASADPVVERVICHVAYFERGLIDCLQNGNWSEESWNVPISCRQTRGDQDRQYRQYRCFSSPNGAR